MTTNPPRPDLLARLGRFIGQLLKFLLRLTFILLLAIGIGWGVYYGAPWAYGALIQPVQTHTAQIAALTQRLDNLNAGLTDSQTAQDARLTTLETGHDGVRERVAALESAATEWQAPLEEETAARATLEAEVAALEAQVTALTDELTAAHKTLAELTAATAAFTQTVSQAQSRWDSESLWLQSRVDLLEAQQHLSAENVGLARERLTTSHATLTQTVNRLTALPAETRAALLNQLAAAELLIATQPAAAWAELMNVSEQLHAALHPSATAEAGP